MVSDQKILYKDKVYQIIAIEQEYIIHPAALNILPLNKSTAAYDFSAEFYLDGYNLFLEKLKLFNTDVGNRQYVLNMCRMSYNGSILIGADIIKEYNIKNSYPACFSYQNVKELIFDDGVLVTTIDHNKEMLRIRKNLELGLRSLNNNRDLRCINHFLGSAFVGDYKPFRLSIIRLKYIKEMKSLYDKEKPAYTQL
jgi:hypothetical protein